MDELTITKIKTERALSKTNIDLADYVINPYRGCEIGCEYCYARINKNVKNNYENWGNHVSVKENIINILKKELDSKNDIKRVLIGSTTEAFQSIESKYNLTENIIKMLSERKIPVVILTKSPLILKYIDILKYSDRNVIYYTINSEIIRKLFEKRSISQNQRLDVIEKIYKSGIKLITYIGPVFPKLTNYIEILENLKGKTENLYFEAYNLKMGNWNIIKKKLPIDIIEFYESIYFDKIKYENYWNNFIENVNNLNKNYNYNIKYFIYPFDSYYNN